MRAFPGAQRVCKMKFMFLDGSSITLERSESDPSDEVSNAPVIMRLTLNGAHGEVIETRDGVPEEEASDIVDALDKGESTSLHPVPS